MTALERANEDRGYDHDLFVTQRGEMERMAERCEHGVSELDEDGCMACEAEKVEHQFDPMGRVR